MEMWKVKPKQLAITDSWNIVKTRTVLECSIYAHWYIKKNAAWEQNFFLTILLKVEAKVVLVHAMRRMGE